MKVERSDQCDQRNTVGDELKNGANHFWEGPRSISSISYRPPTNGNINFYFTNTDLISKRIANRCGAWHIAG